MADLLHASLLPIGHLPLGIVSTKGGRLASTPKRNGIFSRGRAGLEAAVVGLDGPVCLSVAPWVGIMPPCLGTCSRWGGKPARPWYICCARVGGKLGRTGDVTKVFSNETTMTYPDVGGVAADANCCLDGSSGGNHSPRRTIGSAESIPSGFAVWLSS